MENKEIVSALVQVHNNLSRMCVNGENDNVIILADALQNLRYLVSALSQKPAPGTQEPGQCQESEQDLE